MNIFLFPLAFVHSKKKQILLNQNISSSSKRDKPDYYNCVLHTPSHVRKMTLRAKENICSPIRQNKFRS
jgi:hypothetical protein